MSQVEIRAAGVVLTDGAGRVAVVHRPRRADWSLPKGKLEPGEYPLDAAVREVREETAVDVALGSRLPSSRYTVEGRLKEVDYWLARPVADHGFEPHAEIDEVRWVDATEARALLTYPHDVATVELALSRPATSPLVLLRHATAMKRADWSGRDPERPLLTQGISESLRLVSQLRAFGELAVHSSDATRCLQTVEPLAAATDAEINLEPGLSEAAFAHDHVAATDRVAELLRDPRPLVVCTHRPILPLLLRRIVADAGADPADPALDPRIPPGAFIVLHRAFPAAPTRSAPNAAPTRSAPNAAPTLVATETHHP